MYSEATRCRSGCKPQESEKLKWIRSPTIIVELKFNMKVKVYE